MIVLKIVTHSSSGFVILIMTVFVFFSFSKAAL
jgi:hypothetical protein